MLAESQVSGLFLRLFWHLPDDAAVHTRAIFQQIIHNTFPEMAPTGGATFLECFYFLLRQKTLYIAGTMNTNTRY